MDTLTRGIGKIHFLRIKLDFLWKSGCPKMVLNNEVSIWHQFKSNPRRRGAIREISLIKVKNSESRVGSSCTSARMLREKMHAICIDTTVDKSIMLNHNKMLWGISKIQLYLLEDMARRIKRRRF